jgi:dihydropyrimidinase
MIDLALKNGWLVTPSGRFHGGIGIDGGKIIYVGSESGLPQARRVMDVEENLVIPGLIDPHVHTAAGGSSSLEEGLRTQCVKETDGALHGGVTTFGHMMFIRPEQSNLSNLETLISLGEELSYVDFFSHGCVASELHLEEQPILWEKGVTSFKHLFNAYKGSEGMGIVSHTDEGIAFRSLKFIGSKGYPAIGLFHCEELDVFYVLAEELKKQGRKDLKAWTEARTGWVEAMRVHHAFELARGAGAPLYVVHMSCAKSADFVSQKRKEGYPIWGETGPSYLTHTGEMEEQIGCWGKVNPSLKYREDNERLWRGIIDGGVTNLGTDHVSPPLGLKEKGREGAGQGKHNNIWDSVVGLCGGMEHLLPVMMTFGVRTGRISVEDLVRVCSTNTAKVFGLYPKKGALIPGADADIVIVDPDKESIVDKDFYHCRSEFSIYEGWTFKGMARSTILRGEVMLEDYQTIGKPGKGRYIPRPV